MRAHAMLMLVALLGACGGGGSGSGEAPAAPPTGPNGNGLIPEALVLVSRQVATGGSLYYPAGGVLPGAGPHSRFRSAAPGRLLVREPDGSLRILVDGSQPTEATLFIADVNAPDVSWDGRRIVFAGLPSHRAGAAQGVEGYAGGWRLYVINVDGSGLRQLTFDEGGREKSLSDRNLPPTLLPFDDGDPVWIPSGDVVFSSTRYPSYAHYSGVRTSQLHVVSADGQGMRRITAERNGADRPLIDPLTGKIVFSRWWRNHRFPVDSLETMRDSSGRLLQSVGVTSDRAGKSPDAEAMFRNAWQISSINPDGSGLAMWSGTLRDEAANHVYGGVFAPGGTLLANFFPMYNMTEASGFGGIRRYERGARRPASIVGVTDVTGDQARFVAPGSFGVYKLGVPGAPTHYAAEPAVLADGRIVVSLASTPAQDYGLFVLKSDGSEPQKLLDFEGTSELRAKPIRARPLPPVLRINGTTGLSPMPPGPSETLAKDGTFIFEALNIFFNAPVDVDIVSAPAVGDATSIRFYADHQRQATGSFPHQDWPLLLHEAPVSAAGAVVDNLAPAGVPLFEQLRSRTGKVTLTGGGSGAAAHVAGMNFGVPGARATCVGCHAGHSLIEVPGRLEDAEFTNLAPGALIEVSSSRDPRQNRGLVDRRVMKGENWRYWTSSPGQTEGEWVKLTFLVPVTVKAVRLYNPRAGGEAASSIAVRSVDVELCVDSACTDIAGRGSARDITTAGTDVQFDRVRARSVRVRFGPVDGTFYGSKVASLAEIEVIARGEIP